MSSLNDTLRTVLREGIESYSYAVEGDTDQAVKTLRLIKGDIEAFLAGWNGSAESVTHKWKSDCPDGYDTIVGWLAKHDPDRLDPDPSTFCWDDKALSMLCEMTGYDVIAVSPPFAYAFADDVKAVNAYPTTVLELWFRD